MQAQDPAEIPTSIVENSQISESHGANLEASRSFFGSQGAKLGTGIFFCKAMAQFALGHVFA